MLPKRIPKAAKRTARFRSPVHCAWIRGFACCVCGSTKNTVHAHVRKGSVAGMGVKPDDWRAVPLCDGPSSDINGQLGCHNRQHIVGEETFWMGFDVEGLIAELCEASPKAREIREHRRG